MPVYHVWVKVEFILLGRSKALMSSEAKQAFNGINSSLCTFFDLLLMLKSEIIRFSFDNNGLVHNLYTNLRAFSDVNLKF